MGLGTSVITKAGFSLIELIFATIFLTVIIMGVVKLQTSNLTLSNTQKNELKAHFLVAQGLEIVEGVGYSEIESNCNNGSDCVITGSYSLSKNGTEEIDDLYSRSFDTDSSALSNAYLVTMKVSWEDSSGPHTVSAKRIIY